MQCLHRQVLLQYTEVIDKTTDPESKTTALIVYDGAYELN